MQIRISDELKRKGVFIFSCIIENVEVKKDPKIEEEMKRIEEVFSSSNPEELKNDPVVRSYRDFYWSIGIDPTKTRPSGEALRRRIARGKSLPRINNVVDAGNIASVFTLIAIGIYDLDEIRGELKLVESEGGEEFHPIGSEKIEILKKGIPILKDDEKVIHLYPHRDSKKTMVTSKTKNVLVIGAGVKGIDTDLVKKAVELTADLILLSCSNAKIKEIVSG